jgi:4-hydroxy-tetrahydrodipicolinate synthase
MDLGRLVTAMITPFTEDDRLDETGIRRLIDHLLSTGTTGLVVCGTTGESPTLTHDEKLRLVDLTLRSVAGRVPVIMGTGSNDTRSSVALSREVARMGVQGLMVVAPYYNRPSQEGLLAHFEAVASAVDLPMMVYNVPSRTAVRIEVDTLLRLAEVPSVFAVKEATGDLGFITDLCAQKPDDLSVYSGDDKLALPTLAVGGIGVVSVASHVVGPEMTALMDAFFAGDVRTAAQWNGRLVPIFDALFRVSNPGPLKAAMKLMELPSGGVRLPLVEAPNRVIDELRTQLVRLRKLSNMG